MVELKLSEKKQDIQVLLDIHTIDKCREIALASKEKAFSLVHSMKKLFSKKSEALVIHSEKRYEPFWHICAESYLEYKRQTVYQFDVNPEVRSITFCSTTIDIEGANPVCQFTAEDHCVEQASREITRDAVENKGKGLELYIGYPSREIQETEELMGENKVVIPARIKASYLIRELIKELLKPIHADRVIEEMISIHRIVLYFRPIYAFELLDTASGQKGVLEVDAITGDVKKGKIFKTELKELISEDILFELGEELVGKVIPGVGLGMAIGKKIMQSKEQKKRSQAMQSSRKAMESHKKQSS